MMRFNSNDMPGMRPSMGPSGQGDFVVDGIKKLVTPKSKAEKLRRAKDKQRKRAMKIRERQKDAGKEDDRLGVQTTQEIIEGVTAAKDKVKGFTQKRIQKLQEKIEDRSPKTGFDGANTDAREARLAREAAMRGQILTDEAEGSNRVVSRDPNQYLDDRFNVVQAPIDSHMPDDRPTRAFGNGAPDTGKTKFTSADLAYDAEVPEFEDAKYRYSIVGGGFEARAALVEGEVLAERVESNIESKKFVDLFRDTASNTTFGGEKLTTKYGRTRYGMRFSPEAGVRYFVDKVSLMTAYAKENGISIAKLRQLND